MAYITDAGFCGASDGVIGMDYDTSLSRFLTAIPERYEVAKGSASQLNAIEVEVDIKSGKALAVKRIFCNKNNIEKEEESEKED
jgi:calcineurin-like phosphoesterase